MKTITTVLVLGMVLITTTLFSQAIPYTLNIKIPQDNSDAAYLFKESSQLPIGDDALGAPKSVQFLFNVHGYPQYHTYGYGSSLNPLNTMILRFLVPAGANRIIFFFESNDWNGGAIENFSSDYPDTFCKTASGDGNSCGSSSGDYFYQGNMSISANSKTFYFPTLQEAKYYYYVVFNGQSNYTFSLGSVKYTCMISDTNAYNCWRTKRPWAGGPSSNSWNCIGETCSTGLTDNLIQETVLV